MSTENENDNQNTENQQIENNQQEDNGRLQSQTESEIDSALDSFMKDADHAPRTPAQGKTQETQQTPKPGETQQQQTPPNNQQQQTRPNEQGPRENQQTEQVPTGTRQFGNLFRSDNRGNIYDAKGQLIAPSGAGHKLFRRLYPYIERAETEAAGYKTRVENYERATAAAKEAGLSLDEQSASLSLMVAYKKDPKAAIKFLLQQAQNSGTDVSDIVQGGGGIDAATLRTAVQEIVTQALQPFQPFVEQTRQQAEMQRIQEEAAQIYNEFFETKPDATIHKNALASVMEASNFDLQTAYYELKTDALSRGLDWSKPLAPQYAALRAKAGNNQQPNGGGKDQILPDLNGRTGNNVHVDHKSRGHAGAEERWDDIINGVLTEVGATRQ